MVLHNPGGLVGILSCLFIISKHASFGRISDAKVTCVAAPIRFFMSTKPGAVFISHASANQGRAEQFCALLEEKGITCWIASRDIAVGASYPEEISSQIKTSSSVLLLLTGAAMDSDPVKSEIENAMRHRIPITWCRLEKIEFRNGFDYLLGIRHGIDDAYKLGNSEIVELLVAGLKPNAPGSDYSPPATRRPVHLVGALALVLVGLVYLRISKGSDRSDPLPEDAASSGESNFPNSTANDSMEMLAIDAGRLEKDTLNIEKTTSASTAVAKITEERTPDDNLSNELGIELSTTDDRTSFREGETVTYRVSSDSFCHIAVFCHQEDGSTTVLFPNAWSAKTELTAGETMEIPGTGRGGFQIVITPPFGRDVVQVVACSRQSELHKLVLEEVLKQRQASPFIAIPRGMVAQGLEQAVQNNHDSDRWSQVQMVIHTAPRERGESATR